MDDPIVVSEQSKPKRCRISEMFQWNGGMGIPCWLVVDVAAGGENFFWMKWGYFHWFWKAV